jgi:hypothetical protein
MNQDMRSRPFLIDVEKGARITADLIERGVSYSTVPRWPWNVMRRVLRLVPTSMLARRAPRRPD